MYRHSDRLVPLCGDLFSFLNWLKCQCFWIISGNTATMCFMHFFCFLMALCLSLFLFLSVCLSPFQWPWDLGVRWFTELLLSLFNVSALSMFHHTEVHPHLSGHIWQSCAFNTKDNLSKFLHYSCICMSLKNGSMPICTPSTPEVILFCILCTCVAFSLKF